MGELEGQLRGLSDQLEETRAANKKVQSCRSASLIKIMKAWACIIIIMYILYLKRLSMYNIYIYVCNIPA